MSLNQQGQRPTTLLLGYFFFVLLLITPNILLFYLRETIRSELSRELGFSEKDRNINVARIGFVAGEITKCGGAVIASPIAPYESARQEVRKSVEKSGGGFFLIHVNTPLEACIKRDRTGTYAKAIKGEIKGFTGIDDPYEEPKNPNLRVDASVTSVSQIVHEIILLLEKEGYIGER